MHAGRKYPDKLTSTLLAELGEKLPGIGKEDGLYDILSKRRQDYQTYTLRQRALADELAQITARVNASNEILHDQGQQFQAYLALIQEQELAQMYFAKLDLRVQLAAQEKTIVRLELELNQRLSALQVQLQQSDYQSLGSVQELIDLSLRKDEIQSLLTNLQEKIAQYPAEIEALHKQLDAERVHIATQESLESVVIKLRDKKVQMEIAQQEVATLESSLQKQQQLHQENAQLIRHIEQQQKSVQEKQEQQQKIDAESENIFRRRVQIAVAEKLLQLTNSFLDKINGRYHVASVASDLGLAIEIID
ncbi:MAG: hypothetical protein H0A75_01075 [Candidatus Methanofishera endochildressiae]|uniref:Uncharacterized protein n=1 Tax=Candidatus Methanofishera endochildressiae TaxID=2738884 RepID=A0A7Z0SCE4_9GAMM|nr:hypothetical protein [Candidatus Methanofishera endochildressiae]